MVFDLWQMFLEIRVVMSDAYCNNEKYETMIFTKQSVFFVSGNYLPVNLLGENQQKLNTDSCFLILMQPHDKFDLIH